MINLCDLSKLFTKLELATMMTAAICHDLDHPGFNNKYAFPCHCTHASLIMILVSIHVCFVSCSYQINARTELAIRYNDLSPLENHHCAVAFQILEKPETNLFAFVSPEHYKKIRAVSITL